jgi:hypothetical protein
LVTGRTAEGFEFESRRVKNFHSSTLPRSALGISQPPIHWVPRALCPEEKQQVREADHSPPTSAEVKKTWTYTSTPSYAFMAFA